MTILNSLLTYQKDLLHKQSDRSPILQRRQHKRGLLHSRQHHAVYWNRYSLFQCSSGIAADKMYQMLYAEPPKVMLLGPGCSVSAQSTAHSSYLWNITQVIPRLQHLKLQITINIVFSK